MKMSVSQPKVEEYKGIKVNFKVSTSTIQNEQEQEPLGEKI
jgi:hypothetical protein